MAHGSKKVYAHGGRLHTYDVSSFDLVHLVMIDDTQLGAPQNNSPSHAKHDMVRMKGDATA